MADYHLCDLDMANTINRQIAEELGSSGIKVRNIHGGRSKKALMSCGRGYAREANIMNRITGGDINYSTNVRFCKTGKGFRETCDSTYRVHRPQNRNVRYATTSDQAVISHEMQHFKDAFTQFKLGKHYSSTWQAHHHGTWRDKMGNKTSLSAKEKDLFDKELTLRILEDYLVQLF